MIDVSKYMKLTRCMSTDQLDKAEEILKQSMKYSPEEKTLYAIAGEIFSKQGKLAEAEEMYNKAVELDPSIRVGDVKAMIFRGYAATLEIRNELEKADEYLTMAIERQPEESELYGERARIRYKMNKLDLASEDSAKAILVNPLDTFAYTMRAAILTQDGNPLEAIRVLTTGIEHISKYDEKQQSIDDKKMRPIIYVWRGQILESIGQIEKARDDFHQAVLLDPLLNDEWARTANEGYIALTRLLEQ